MLHSSGWGEVDPMSAHSGVGAAGSIVLQASAELEFVVLMGELVVSVLEDMGASALVDAFCEL